MAAADEVENGVALRR